MAYRATIQIGYSYSYVISQVIIMIIDDSEFGTVLSDFLNSGGKIVNTIMDDKLKVIKFWVEIPKGEEGLASSFKRNVQSFYHKYDVVVRAKEV